MTIKSVNGYINNVRDDLEHLGVRGLLVLIIKYIKQDFKEIFKPT